MNAVSVVEDIRVPDSESNFLSSIVSRSDPRLAAWARNYYYFSVNQARHLALMIRAVDPRDSACLSEIAKALYEEYGSGVASGVHSVLFARFVRAVTGDANAPSIDPASVVPAVRAYVDEIESAYRDGDVARAVGAYAYLERSAVLSYPIMLENFRRLGFSDEELEFFSLHVVQEAGHDAAAALIIVAYIYDDRMKSFSDQVARMHERWSDVWAVFA